MARAMTSGMVTTQEYDPSVVGGEMGNLQPSPYHLRVQDAVHRPNGGGSTLADRLKIWSGLSGNLVG